MNTSKLLIIGTASLDTLHFGGQTAHTIGGAGLYTALAAQFAGAEVTLLAPKPDPIPEILRPLNARVSWIGPAIAPEDLPRLEIAHHGGGKATLIDASWGAEAALTPDHLPRGLEDFDFVHVAALSSAARMLAFVKAARRLGALRVSASTYARLVFNEPANVRLVYEQTDAFFMNENEAVGLWGSSRVVDKMTTRASDDGLLFVTFDKRGVMVIAKSRAESIPAEPAEELDPTGAGDTFCGATLAGLARGEHPIIAAQNATLLAARVIEHIGPEFLLGFPLL
ncbi:MAG: carbohydrate kinase family protein [Anaerolineae bacterium]